MSAAHGNKGDNDKPVNDMGLVAMPETASGVAQLAGVSIFHVKKIIPAKRT